MTVSIIGAGALGSIFGAYLQDNGEDVVLYDIDKEHIDAINESGLFVERPDREDLTVFPNATTDASTVDPVDIAFIFVKAFQTETAMQSAAPLYDDDTTIVTLQNGLKNVELISQFVPEENILAGATTVGSSMEGPGHVLHTGHGATTLGGEDTNAAEHVGRMLTNAGFEMKIVDDPRPEIWRKQFISVGIKPVAALTELLDGPLADNDETRTAMRRLIEEAMEVASAKDIDIISEDPVEDAFHTCEINYKTKSSMLEDVEKGRPTEIDHINGSIVEYGEEEDVETPYNRLVTELVKGKEYSYNN